MQTPEERREYIRWYRKQYAEHIKYRRRVQRLRKQGIADPEAFIEAERQEAERRAEMQKWEREFPWLRLSRLAVEAQANAEAKVKKAKNRQKAQEQQERKKASEDYVAMLIALEEERKNGKKE